MKKEIDRVINKSDDLRLPKYRGHSNPYKGHCYVVSEAVYFLKGGKKAGLTPRIMHVGKDTHWFLIDKSGNVYDYTYKQFKKKPDYTKARSCGFLTKHPSKRATEFIKRYYEQCTYSFR